MTISAQIDYLMSHPYMGEARRDDAAMRQLLWEVMFGMWGVCSADAARTYRGASGSRAEVSRALREMAPPIGLDIRLPIPIPREEAVVMRLVMAKKIRVRLLPNPFQTEIEFPDRLYEAAMIAAAVCET